MSQTFESPRFLVSSSRSVLGGFSVLSIQKLGVAVLVACLATTSMGQIHVDAVTQAVVVSTTTYTVQQGDNDWAIAKKFGTTPGELHRLNPKVDWKKLQIGAKIVVPSKDKPKPKAPAQPKPKAQTVSVPANAKRFSVKSKDVNLRSGPGTTHSVVRKVTTGNAGAILESRSNGWHKVKFTGGTIGWIRGDMITIHTKAKATPPVAKNETKAEPTKPAVVAEKPTTTEDKVVETPPTTNDTTAVQTQGQTAAADTEEATVVVAPPLGGPAEAHLAKEAAAEPEVKEPVKPAIVVATNVNVRSGPGINTSRVRVVDRGAKAEIVLFKDGWCKLKFSDGKYGWVRRDLLALGHTLPKSEPLIAGNVGKSVSAILATAHDHLGTRYVYGGANRSGFDCSGFVLYSYAKHGIKLPRTSSSMAGVGQKVERKDLIAGDLVFFRTTRGRRISHVGIYIGNGKFIHASSGGGKVQINTINEGYYNSRYAGARRIISDEK